MTEELAEARAARGLPPYRKVAPSVVRSEMRPPDPYSLRPRVSVACPVCGGRFQTRRPRTAGVCRKCREASA